MVERRDVLRGTAALAAASLVGERVSPAQDNGALDLALERFARTGPEYHGGLANHGPMAAEALVTLGRGGALGRGLRESPRAVARRARLDPRR